MPMLADTAYQTEHINRFGDYVGSLQESELIVR